MTTDLCSADLFGFAAVEGHEVVAGFDGGSITSDAGGLLLGSADDAVRLTERFAACFHDARNRHLIEHEVVTLVGQRVFGIALGYEDLNDHDQLRHDPMMAALAGKLAARRKDCATSLAGKSTLNRLELSRLEPSRYHKISHNPIAIKRLLVDLFLEAHKRALKETILDLDATDDPLHGHQEGRFFHGYYDCYCYLPLYIFCGRHLLAARLRPANRGGAAGALEEGGADRPGTFLRQRWPKTRILLRADSGFAGDALMAWCEAQGVDFILGLQRNTRLVAEIDPELALAEVKSRRTGRPARYFRQFMWTTERHNRWTRKRRVVAKAEFTKGEANPHFVVTSLRWHECGAPGYSLREALLCARRHGRIGSRSASSISSPIAPRLPRCGPTSCACGSPRWPTSCSAPCAGSACPTRGWPMRPAAPSASSYLGKIGALVRVSVRRIKFAMASSYPMADVWGDAALRLLAAARARASPA